MKIFYGWKMVFAAASLQFIQSMMLHQAFGAYVAVLIQEKQWSKTSVSGASAMMSMEAAVIGPLLGWFLDRFGSRGVIKVGVIFFGIGFMLMSQVDTLLSFYGAVVVIAIGSSMAGYFPLNVGVIQWFEKKTRAGVIDGGSWSGARRDVRSHHRLEYRKHRLERDVVRLRRRGDLGGVPLGLYFSTSS